MTRFPYAREAYAARLMKSLFLIFTALPLMAGQASQLLAADSGGSPELNTTHAAFPLALGAHPAGTHGPAVTSSPIPAALSVDPPAGEPAYPDRTQATVMIKATLIALNQGNITGNYTVLRDLGSPRFRSENNAAQLASVFTPMRERNLDISPILVFEPVLQQPFGLDELGQLRFVGHFPTEPLRVEFDLQFETIGTRWMISNITVAMSPAHEDTNPADSLQQKQLDTPDGQPEVQDQIEESDPASD